MKIKATANIDGQIIICLGDIQINWIKEPQAYITWRLFNGKTLVASKSENFHYRENVEEADLVQKVIKKIEKYRINRNKVFSNVELITR